MVELKGKNNSISLLKATQYIQSLLKDYCKVDLSASRVVGVQKPTHKEKLIYYHNGNNVLEFYFEESKKIIQISDNAFLNLCLKTYESLGFYVCRENNEIINLGHPKEKTKCGYFIYKNNPQICHHFNKEKTFTIFDYIKNNPLFKEYNQQRFLESIERKIYIPVNNIITFNHRYIDIKKLRIENIEDNEVIYVKSPMGTGKTNIIQKLQENKRTLIITNRVTLAEEYKEKFPHFKLYNKELYFEGDSLITQFESLHRYNLKNFDLIVIDEFMSLIEHSLSGLTEYKDINNLKLFYILQKINTPLLIMDAFLTGFETKLVKREKYRYFKNTYRDENNLYLYENINCFINSIEENLEKKDGKITLSTTNKSFAKIIYELFKDRYKIALITSETENKKFYTRHFHKDYHNEWDLLIYTPTITTGINILNESKHHYHYSDGTGSVISSLQQIKRNRKAEDIHFFLRGKKFNKIIDLTELKTDIQKKLNQYAIKSSLYAEFDKYANPRLSEFGEFHIKKLYLHNLFSTNPLHIFKMFLKEQFKKEIIEKNSNCKEYPVKEVKEKIKTQEKEKILEKLDGLLNADSLDFQLLYETDFKELKEHIDKYFVNLSQDDIKEIVRISTLDKNFIKNIKYIKLYHIPLEELKNLIGISIVENLNKNLIKNLEILYEYKKKNVLLKDKFFPKEAKDKKFRNFLKLLGYKKQKSNFVLKDNILKFLNKIKIG